MSPAHEQLYRRTLHELVAAGLDFCVIGSLAWRWQCPALHWPARDCDLLLPFDVARLNQLVGLLQARGWTLTLWQEPVALPLTKTELHGKYYLRARQQEAILDLSYENDYQPWAQFTVDWVLGLPLASVPDLLHQCAQRNSPADQHLLRQWRAGEKDLPEPGPG